MLDESLDSIQWAEFRIFLSQLEDPELDKVFEQFHDELLTRQACDCDCARLFFSSLTASDLEVARQQIAAEKTGRIEDAKILGLLAAVPTESLPDASRKGSLQNAVVQQNLLACGAPQSDECVDRVRRRGSKEKTTIMTTTFILSDDNKITRFAGPEEIAAAGNATANGVLFDTQSELARLSAAWPMSRFVDIYNGIRDNGKVKKFADRTKAVERIWRAIQPQVEEAEVKTNAAHTPGAPAVQKDKPRQVKSTSKQEHKAAKKSKTSKSKTSKTQKAKVGEKAREPGGKKAMVVAMMKRARGVTLDEIRTATGWQAHTVRGLVSILGSKGGEKIESSKNAAGERSYRIIK